MPSAYAAIREIYRATNKPHDFLFNRIVCRPVAAVLVYALRSTRITPNQVTFASLLVALVALTMMLLWRTHLGLALSALVLILAFVLDCTDGQLARMRGQTSSVGAWLDFLMDEIKAVSLVAALAGRLGWMAWEVGQPHRAMLWLGLGMAGVVVVACGIALTTFMRRPEYVQYNMSPTAPAVPVQKTSPAHRLLKAVERGGQWVINYPSWIWLPAVLGHAEWFLIPYLVVMTAHLGYAGLRILFRLGRFA